MLYLHHVNSEICGVVLTLYVFSWNRKNVQYKTVGAEGRELKSSRDFSILQVNLLVKVYMNTSLIGINLFYKNLHWWGIYLLWNDKM